MVEKLEGDVSASKVSTSLIWRLDRLGRTAAGVLAQVAAHEREAISDRIVLQR